MLHAETINSPRNFYFVCYLGENIYTVGETTLFHPRQIGSIRVSFSFLPKGGGGGGGKMRLYGLLGGQVRICVQSMGQSRGVWGHGPLGKFCFLTFY